MNSRSGYLLIIVCVSAAIVFSSECRSEESETPFADANPAPDLMKLFKARSNLISTKTKKVKAAYLGISTVSADATLRTQLKLPEGVGLVVNYVAPDGPAHQAGIQLHDVL